LEIELEKGEKMQKLTESQQDAVRLFAQHTAEFAGSFIGPRTLPDFGERNARGNGLCRALSGAAKRGALEQDPDGWIAYRVPDVVREEISVPAIEFNSTLHADVCTCGAGIDAPSHEHDPECDCFIPF
jgi:hypothetical protein